MVQRLDQSASDPLASTPPAFSDEAARQVLHDGDLVVWTADLPGNRHALAAFNLGEKPINVDRLLASLGLHEDQYNATNAWTGERLHMGSRLRATLEPHASTVLILDGK